MNKALLFALALSTIACGTMTDAPLTGSRAAKSEGTTAGADTLLIASTASSRAPRPVRDRDLRLRIHASSPIGPLAFDRDYVVGVEILNRAEVPIAIGDARLSAMVFEGARVARGCDARAEAGAIHAPLILMPGQSHVVSIRPPCVLRDRGRYELRVTLECGPEDGPVFAEETARAEIVIEPGR